MVIPTAALECASAEATTKELVTEVREQEKLLRAVEVMMTAQRPTDEVQRRATYSIPLLSSICVLF